MGNERLHQLREIAEREPDDALAQYGLGKAYLNAKRYDEAIETLSRAILVDPKYSAAYRDLGRAYLDSRRAAQAIKTLRKGISVAERRGDLQTVREMKVFMRRATRKLSKRGDG